MTLLARFDTPGAQRDLPATSPLYEKWHKLIKDKIQESTPGTSGIGEFFNPSMVNVDVLSERSLTWMAFPRQLLVVNHRDQRRTAFDQGDRRDRQGEYCEWHVTRDDSGKIVKVVFVTETPEYWQSLWEVDPDRVLSLYQELVSEKVVAADLVKDTQYNPENRWNKDDGIVHFIHSANTLNAALFTSHIGVKLAEQARTNYEVDTGKTTSVDSRVMLDMRCLARRGWSISLSEPIGVYMIDLDVTGWTKPDGSPVDDYVDIKRGAPGRMLRFEYEVPAAEGFVVGDIRIGGRAIEFGGQIAEHITSAIVGIAGERAQ